MRRKMFAALAVIGMMMVFGGAVFAQAQGVAAADSFKDYGLLAAGLGIALASFGGAFGQGRTASAALEGIARNPGAADRMFVPMVLGLVLIESLVIYALVVEILILFT